jgi:hypothetical protein
MADRSRRFGFDRLDEIIDEKVAGEKRWVDQEIEEK